VRYLVRPLSGVSLLPSNATHLFGNFVGVYNLRYICIKLVMTKLYEQMLEDILHESGHEDKNRVHKTITATGDVQTSLDGSSVYSVRTNCI